MPADRKSAVSVHAFVDPRETPEPELLEILDRGRYAVHFRNRFQYRTKRTYLVVVDGIVVYRTPHIEELV